MKAAEKQYLLQVRELIPGFSTSIIETYRIDKYGYESSCYEIWVFTHHELVPFASGPTLNTAFERFKEKYADLINKSTARSTLEGSVDTTSHDDSSDCGTSSTL